MNNYSKIRKKSFFQKIKAMYWIIAIVYIIFGLGLLIQPETSTKVLCNAIGVLSLIYAIVIFIKYFTTDGEMNLYQLDFVSAVISAVIGIIVLAKPIFIISIFPTILGVTLVLSSIIKLQDSLELKKCNYHNWKVVLIFSVIAILLGIVMIVNPFGTGMVFVRFIGISFILDGVFSVTSSIMLNICK